MADALHLEVFNEKRKKNRTKKEKKQKQSKLLFGTLTENFRNYERECSYKNREL